MRKGYKMNLKKLIITILIISLPFFATANSNNYLIEVSSNWKFCDRGEELPSAWKTIDYDEANWQEGKGQFGYGDEDENTVISFGDDEENKHPTTYFRKLFNIEDPSQFNQLYVQVLRDDGAVGYLNGVEIFRTNMPEGEIKFGTFAKDAASGGEEDIFNLYEVDPSLLRKGKNVLAVEIHQAYASSSDISFDLQLANTKHLEKKNYGLTEKQKQHVNQPRFQQTFLKNPYLISNGNNTEMQVLWQLNEKRVSEIFWGTDSSYSSGSAKTSEYGDDHQHKYLITGLTPNTKFYYNVSVDDVSKTGSFLTPPKADATELKFLAYGDTRSYPENHNKVAKQIYETIKEDPGYQSFILFNGDFVDDGDIESDWDLEFFDPQYKYIQYLLSHVPFQSSMGNHEHSGILFEKYFPYPFINKRYWSFDYGPAHLIILDQYRDLGKDSEQLNWLKQDLAKNKKKWKIICLHEPGWTAGVHDNNQDVQEYIQPLCIKHDVKLVLAGHSHYYARAVVDGINHISTGGGGAPLYTPDPDKSYITKAVKTHHFLKIHIKDNRLICTAIDAKGFVIDSFSLQM